MNKTMTSKRQPTIDGRFLIKTEKLEDGCIIWKGTTATAGGYGKFSVNGKMVFAHRWAYERFVEKIPTGLEIDHLCRNRKCVNPQHLQPVTHLENMRRAPHTNIPGRPKQDSCQRGHLYTPENEKWNKGRTSRCCRTCSNENHRIRRSTRMQDKNLRIKYNQYQCESAKRRRDRIDHEAVPQ